MLAFHSGRPPEGFKKDFESFLFNTNIHWQTQSKTGWKEFHLLSPHNNKVLASVAFHIKRKNANNPLKAPFGSYEFSESLTLINLVDFVLGVEKSLRKSGVKKVEIVNHPGSHTKTHSKLCASLLFLNYSPFQCDLSCAIKVDNRSLVFKLSNDKRLQFQKCIKQKLSYKKLPLSKFEEVYDFIKVCRGERGQILSLTKRELKEIIFSLPKVFILVGVYKEKELIAASVCMRITKTILYTFYSAHKKQFDNLSPLTFLLANLYEWCYKKRFTLLDLGTSMTNGKPNFNLLEFKLRVGGTVSPKFSFRKTL